MRRYSSVPVFAIILGIVLALFAPLPGLPAISVASAAELPNGNGYADFKYHNSGETPTGEKPQSKLWHNDGRWWADMIYPDGKHYIFYLDLASQTWVKTATELDQRTATKSDCLWDGTHLYVVSGGASASAFLYRYSYNPSTQTYSKDFGPITVRAGGAEAVVLDKDSTGRLWITYTQTNKVWVNRSTTADNVWSPAAAFNPPSAPSESNSTTVDQDDISTLVAFDDKIGVLWSKHSTSVTTDPNAAFYFSYREDDAADTVAAWQTKKIYSGPNMSDDHMNIKSLQVAGKEIYAVVKTSLAGSSPSSPMIVLLGRRADGSWITPVVVSSAADGLTRPLLLIDSEQRKLHIFTSTEGGGNIYYKQSSMDNISFPTGKGSTFIEGGGNTGLTSINNATSTKQTINSATGIAVLASDDNAKWYVHRYLSLGGDGPRVAFDPSQSIGEGQAGVVLDQQPVVLVQSHPGQTDTSYDGPVSIAIKSGTGAAGASLLGTATVNAVDGIARFSNLAINKVGTNYRLTASVAGHTSGDSNAFDIAISNQTISFAALPNKIYGDPPFALNASASSNLSVSYSASGACTLSGTSLTIVNVGSCSVTARQPGNANYAPAPNITRNFSISKRNQSINFAVLPNRHFTDTPFTISATASSGLAVGFSASGVCTTAGGMVNLISVGTCTITATQAGSAHYNAAQPVARSFTVVRFFNVFLPLIDS